MKDIVNTKIKFRESYRLFAPSVVVEKAGEFFDLFQPARHFPARFMLYVVDVREDKWDIIPAVTHVAGTRRLQTVRREENPRYYRLIETFGQARGVPVVLNTSFNLKDEPIVNTPREAFNAFTQSGMDGLGAWGLCHREGRRDDEKGMTLMRFMENLSSRMGITVELLQFFWQNKWWWLTPIVLVLLMFGGLVIFAQSSAIVPFIYTLF